MKMEDPKYHHEDPAQPDKYINILKIIIFFFLILSWSNKPLFAQCYNNNVLGDYSKWTGEVDNSNVIRQRSLTFLEPGASFVGDSSSADDGGWHGSGGNASDAEQQVKLC